MKNAIMSAALAFGVMLSGTAFAETAKPVKPAVKVDTITTQSVEPASDASKCGTGLGGFKTIQLCRDASAYPVNPMSGLNLN